MKITNKQGLPEPFVDMARSDYQYREGRYSVTALLKGYKEMLLERRHHNEIEQDVSDMIWLLFGTAVHSILESAQETNEQIKEVSLEEEFCERTISGRFDLYDAETESIEDYKTCSVWKVIKGDFTDWKRQLLLYGLLLRRAGFPVKQGRIIAIMKDHSKAKAKFDTSYPDLPVKVIRFPLGFDEFTETQEWLCDKIEQIKRYEQMADDDIPECTPEERYNTGDTFAVKKKTRKTALRVLSTKEEAESWMEQSGGDYIEERKGEDKKCESYCRVSEFCNYWRMKNGRD